MIDESKGAFRNIQCDASGNLYVALEGPTQPDGSTSRFIRKIGTNGSVDWDREFALFSFAVHAPFEVTVGDDGAVYVTGFFDRQITFDPGGANVTMEGFVTAPPPEDAAPDPRGDHVIAKLTVDGELEWMVVLGTQAVPLQYHSSEYRMTVAAPGSVYHWSRIDPRLGSSARTLWVKHSSSVAQQALTRFDNHDSLIKFDSTGQILWHRQFFDDILFDDIEVQTMSIESTGKLLIAGSYGSFSAGVDFDPGLGRVVPRFTYAGPNTNTRDLFLLRLTPGGDYFDLAVSSTEHSDAAFSYGRGGGMGHVIASPITAIRKPPVVPPVTIEFAVPGSEYQAPRIDEFGIIRLDSAGVYLDSRPLPHLASQYAGVGAILPDPNAVLDSLLTVYSVSRRTPVNDTGDYFVAYRDKTGPLLPEFDTHALVKLDDQLRERWRASFQLSGNTPIHYPYVRVTANNAVYFAAQVRSQLDMDPTSGTDIIAPPFGTTLFFITRLTDIPAPDVVAVTRLDADPTNASTVRFLVTLSEPVTGVDSTDFIATGLDGVTGASVTGVTGADAQWTVTVATGSGEGAVRLDVIDDESIESLTGEPLTDEGPGNGDFDDGEAYTIDRTSPLPTFGLLGSPYSVSNTAQILLTFSEPITGLDAADFAVTNGAITNITGDGTDFVITVLITNPGDMTVDLIGDGFTDIAGNGNGAATGPIITFLDLNGDPSVPGPVGGLLVILGCGAAVTGVAALRRAGFTRVNRATTVWRRTVRR